MATATDQKLATQPQPAADEAPGLLQQLTAAVGSVVQKAEDMAAAVTSGVSSGPGDEREGEPSPPGGGDASLPAPATPTAAGAPRPRPAVPALPAGQPPPPAKPLPEKIPATGHSYYPVVGRVEECPRPRPGRVTAEPYNGATGAQEPSTPASGRGRSAAQTHGQDEDWVSELVECLWPYLRGATEDMAKQMLPGILESSKPSWIHDLTLKKFVLGNKEPDLSNIRVWSDENDFMDDTFLEFNFEWKSEQDVEIEIQTLPSNFDISILPNFVERKIADVLNFTVGVEKAVLKGSVRLTMRPLFKRLPVVGAVQVALVQQPDFDFDLTLGSSTNVPMEPSIKDWLRQTLRETVFQPYCIPEHYFHSLDSQAEDVDKPVGVLIASIIEAKHVPTMDFFSFSSPYLSLYVRDTQRRKTAIKENTKHPRWNETFELPVHVPEHQELRMTLWDYDWASPDDEIGRVNVPVKDLEPGKTQDLWLDVEFGADQEYHDQKHDMKKRQRAAATLARPLLHQGGARRCKLHLEVTYITFSEQEQQLIARSSRGGVDALLASPEGRELNPHLRKLLQSGVVRVTVDKVERLDVRGLFGRPSVKAKIRAGKESKELAAAKANRSGHVDYAGQAQELSIDADDRRDSQAAVTVELAKAGWLTGGTIGEVRTSLQEVISRGRVTRTLPLSGGGRGRVTLTLEWKPHF